MALTKRGKIKKALQKMEKLPDLRQVAQIQDKPESLELEVYRKMHPPAKPEVKTISQGRSKPKSSFCEVCRRGYLPFQLQHGVCDVCRNQKQETDKLIRTLAYQLAAKSVQREIRPQQELFYDVDKYPSLRSATYYDTQHHHMLQSEFKVFYNLLNRTLGKDIYYNEASKALSLAYPTTNMKLVEAVALLKEGK